MIEAVFIGLAAGVVAGLLGVGGGVLFVPALTVFLDLDHVDAEATSLLAIVPVALIGSMRQRALGNIEIREAVLIGVLAVAGAGLGVVLANVLPERALQIGFGLLLFYVAYGLVRKALAGAPATKPSSRTGG